MCLSFLGPVAVIQESCIALVRANCDRRGEAIEWADNARGGPDQHLARGQRKMPVLNFGLLRDEQRQRGGEQKHQCKFAQGSLPEENITLLEGLVDWCLKRCPTQARFCLSGISRFTSSGRHGTVPCRSSSGRMPRPPSRADRSRSSDALR